MDFTDGFSSVVHWLWGHSGGVASEVKDFVYNVVNHAVGIIKQALSWVDNGVHFVAGLLVDAVNAVRSLAQSAWDSTVDIVTNKIPHAADFVLGLLGDVRDELLGLIHTLVNGAMAVINFVGASLHNFVDWVQNTALPDIWNWIHGAFDWVYHNMILPLAAVFQGLFDQLKHWADFAWGFISEAWNWVTQHGFAIADLIYRASAWLVWMATHPFTFFLDLWNTLVREVPGAFIDALVRAIESEGSHVEDWVVNAFGR